VSNGFVSEFRYARLRARGSSLFLPMLLLFAESAVLSFVWPKLPQDDASVMLRSIFIALAAAIALVFWFIPLIRHLSNWIEITNANVIVASGLFGSKRQVSLRNIQQVQVVGRSKLVLSVAGEPDIEFSRLAKARTIATELQKLVG
jgi:membrane protein YdbS with pleckstrin-like domain